MDRLQNLQILRGCNSRRAAGVPMTLSFLNGSQGVNETDEALVLASQRGDRAAFEELVRRSARLVFSRLYLETGDSHKAEDLAQETFLVAWRSIRQVTNAKGFRSWLFSIAHSVVIDSVRREGRRKRSGKREDADALLRIADGRATPDESAQREESKQQVLSVLRSLPEEYRLPITLRYIAGADYDTIGQQLGLSNGSLRGLLNRGMAQLRSAMGMQRDDENRASRGTGL